jgi:hypothetical protein
MIGSAIVLVGIVGIILGVTLSGGKGGDVPVVPTENPMVAIYNSQPDFSKYAKGGKDQIFTTGLWTQSNYGGPVTDPIRKTTETGIVEVPNQVSNQLSIVFDNRGLINGVFKLKNLQKDNSFFDIDIFTSDIGSEEEQKVLEAAQSDDITQLEDVASLLTGYVRLIKFLPTAEKDGKPDPSQKDQNEIQEVFEGFFQAGGPSKDARYGRWFKNGVTCYLGFFSFDQDNMDYRFYGKGLQYTSSGQLVDGTEGIYEVTAMDKPKNTEVIKDFIENQAP